MKFEYNRQLEDFLRKQNIFPQLNKLQEINVGGASYNFVVTTDHEKYFLKLLDLNGGNAEKIKYICNYTGLLYPLKIDVFMHYKMIVMYYIDGEKVDYGDFTAEFTEQLVQEYQKLQACPLQPEQIGQMSDIREISDYVEQKLRGKTGFFWQRIYQIFAKQIEAELCCLPPVFSIIHGDFKCNNILLTTSGATTIIDWEQMRYGYAAEDWAGLILELSGFRSLCGSEHKLRKLHTAIQRQFEFSPEQWQYGLQLFYLNILKRRAAAEKLSARKQLCLWLCLLSYGRALKVLQNSI